MKTHLECIPCFIKQSIEAASMVTNNEQIQIKVLNEVMKYLQNKKIQVLLHFLSPVKGSVIYKEYNKRLKFRKDIPCSMIYHYNHSLLSPL